jgi:uncharacterized protein with HEPN domain
MVAPLNNRTESPVEKLAAFCRRWGIARLELFGPALRGDFNPSSDLKFLYTPGNGFQRVQAYGLRGRNVAGRAREDFLSDFKTQCAVQHQVMGMGEATKRLSAEFRGKYTETPRDDLAGMRDRCIHGCDQVDLEIVWQVTQDHAPQLARYLDKVLPSPPRSSD